MLPIKTPGFISSYSCIFWYDVRAYRKRGRSYEQLSFDPSLYDYYKELNRRYDQWYEEYKESPKIQIDGDRYNFVEDPQAKEEVLKMIEEKLAEIRQTKVAIWFTVAQIKGKPLFERLFLYTGNKCQEDRVCGKNTILIKTVILDQCTAKRCASC